MVYSDFLKDLQPQNPLGTIQHCTDIILSSLRWQFAWVHLGDTIIISKSPAKYIDHVQQVLMLLTILGNTEHERCEFFTIHKDYLGHVIKAYTHLKPLVAYMGLPTLRSYALHSPCKMHFAVSYWILYEWRPLSHGVCENSSHASTQNYVTRNSSFWTVKKKPISPYVLALLLVTNRKHAYAFPSSPTDTIKRLETGHAPQKTLHMCMIHLTDNATPSYGQCSYSAHTSRVLVLQFEQIMTLWNSQRLPVV